MGISELIQKEITLTNRLGLHARPAAMVVQLASKFKSEIKLKKEDVEVNAKSIMGVMMLAAEMGSKIFIRAEGEDETQAVEALAKLFDDKFRED
jgi:phosphocarrier protein